MDVYYMLKNNNNNNNLPLTSSSLVPLCDLATKKMIVIIIIRPISFDSVDLELDSVILINEKYSGSEQSFKKWIIRRQVDQQPEIVY
ncbi:unnamed protein product [Adineta steineri]|uniref:Uncharacterized protein n=1 Tax=Adineta steineri TaxID=433720 RepID=A0A815N9W6_9BILA|nr:unnamed protein product [Adineta steineri]CAF3899717.1 unnamed protein product [Adineta steineri]